MESKNVANSIYNWSSSLFMPHRPLSPILTSNTLKPLPLHPLHTMPRNTDLLRDLTGTEEKARKLAKTNAGDKVNQATPDTSAQGKHTHNAHTQLPNSITNIQHN